MEFRCIEECSQCCIEREYYPSKKFGKIGVLILPEEKTKIDEKRSNVLYVNFFVKSTLRKHFPKLIDYLHFKILNLKAKLLS